MSSSAKYLCNRNSKATLFNAITKALSDYDIDPYARVAFIGDLFIIDCSFTPNSLKAASQCWAVFFDLSGGEFNLKLIDNHETHDLDKSCFSKR